MHERLHKTASLLSLRLLGEAARHELVGIEPLVDCGLDAGHLRSAEGVRRSGGDALLVGSVGQVADDLLHQHLLLYDHGHLLQLLHAGGTASSCGWTGGSEVAARLEVRDVVACERLFDLLLFGTSTPEWHRAGCFCSSLDFLWLAWLGWTRLRSSQWVSYNRIE